jgi:hypothetical protein
MNAIASTAFKTGIGLLGDAASKAYGAVSKTGKAMGSLASNLNDAAQNTPEEKKQPTSNIIIGNFGMAGTAGRQKITGTGTIPLPKAVSKTNASEKMPTEALLDSVVKYLTSIDKSLKSQLELDKQLYDQQIRDSQEAIIEEKKPTPFEGLKERLSGLSSNTKDASSNLGTIAKYTAGLAAAAALVASSLDTTELDQLKTNIDAFKQKFEWLSEIPAGGLAGFLLGILTGKGLKGKLVGGLAGGIIGIVTSAVADVLVSRMNGEQISEGTKSTLNVAAGGAMAYLGYRGVKSGIGLTQKLSAVKAARVAYQANAGIAGKRAAIQTVASGSAKTGIAFLKGPMWRKFLAFLLARGKKELVRKIEQRIAIALASGAIASTGVGAAFGAIGFLLNLGFSLWLMYEVYQLWQEFTATTEAEKAGVGDAEISKEIKKSDAAPVTASSIGATVVSKSETGRPEEAQAFFQSKGWTKEQAAGIVGNLVVESRLKTDAVGDGGQAYGIAQWHPPRQAKFKEVYRKDIRNSSFQEQLEFVNWELNNSEKAAGNALRKATTASEAATIVDEKYERSAGLHTAERVSNANAVMAGDYGKLSTGGASGYSSTSTSDSMGETAGKVMSSSIASVGKVIGAIGSSVIKPGVARSFAPMVSNTPEKINNESMKVQNDITFGIKKEKSKDLIKAPTTPNGVSIAKPVKSFSNMDPNYSKLDVLTAYLGHFRMAP